VIGAVSVSPTTRRLGFYFQTDPKEYFTPQKVVTFLRQLLRHLRGKVIVVWDGGTNHKGPAIREFLERNTRLQLERLPSYAPNLNPVEAVWSWLKYGQLSNYVPDGVDTLNTQVTERLVALKGNTRLLRQLWKGSELPFPQPKLMQSQQPADQ
jgi:transposase